MVGMGDHYEITFLQRTGFARPWLMVEQGGGATKKQRVMGQPGTGLMILDQNGYDGLATGLQVGPYNRAMLGQGRVKLPAYAWPAIADAAELMGAGL